MPEAIISKELLDKSIFASGRRKMYLKEEGFLYCWKYIESLKEHVTIFIDKRGMLSWAHTGPFLMKTATQHCKLDEDHFLCAMNFEKRYGIKIKVWDERLRKQKAVTSYHKEFEQLHQEYTQLIEKQINDAIQTLVIYITTSI